MEAKFGDVMKNGEEGIVKSMKELFMTAAPQQVAVGTCDSTMFQCWDAPWSDGTKIVQNQLTIFYGGRVSVFESIPAGKVREIMFMAAKNTEVKSSTGNYSSPVLTRSPSLQSSTANAYLALQIMYNPLCKLQAEFPITRRHSLKRFFEKRRDRLVNKAPYLTNTAGGKETDHIRRAVTSPEAA